MGDRLEADGGNWATFLVKVVSELIKHDVSTLNQTFVLALGRLFDPEVFDLLSTLGKVKEEQSYIDDLRSRKSKKKIIQEVVAILERSGAESVGTWGEMDILLKVVDDTTAAEILYYLQRNPDFTERFVYECLPCQCRQKRSGVAKTLSDKYWSSVFYGSLGVACVAMPAVGFSYLAVAGTLGGICALQSGNLAVQQWVKENSVREAIEKGKQLLAEIRTGRKVTVGKAAISSIQSASELLHTSIGDRVTVKQVDELLKTVQPYVYRRSPLIQAVQNSVDLFSDPQFGNHQKILFILSDGQRDDGNNPHQKLSDLGVIIVKCLITDQRLPVPIHVNMPRSGPFKFTFRKSSTNTAQNIPRTLFMERGWEIDKDIDVKNKLFQEGMFFKVLSFRFARNDIFFACALQQIASASQSKPPRLLNTKSY